MNSTSFLALSRASSPFWQRLVCQSVRLYLTLEEHPSALAEADTQLRTVEGQLVWHLLQGRELSPETTAEAWAILEAAQARLLSSPLDLRDCLGHLSMSQSLHLVQWPGPGE
jgi:hypothetical protein